MTTFKDIFYNADVLIQFLLVSAAATLGVMTLAAHELTTFYFTALFFTGLWQLFSAAIWGVVFRQEVKLIYFAAAALYCILLYLGFSNISWNNNWSRSMLVGFIGVLPIIAACIYFWMTVQEQEEAEQPTELV